MKIWVNWTSDAIQLQDSMSLCSHGAMVLTFQAAGDSFYWGIYRQPPPHVLNLLCQSLNMGGMGYTVKKSTMKIGDPLYLRKALVNNLGEEKRTRLHVQKLQKALLIRFREIDKEKTALKIFLGKLHTTTGYFPRQPFWWPVPLTVKSLWTRFNTKLICISFCYLHVN